MDWNEPLIVATLIALAVEGRLLLDRRTAWTAFYYLSSQQQPSYKFYQLFSQLPVSDGSKLDNKSPDPCYSCILAVTTTTGVNRLVAGVLTPLNSDSRSSRYSRRWRQAVIIYLNTLRYRMCSEGNRYSRYWQRTARRYRQNWIEGNWNSVTSCSIGRLCLLIYKLWDKNLTLFPIHLTVNFLHWNSNNQKLSSKYHRYFRAVWTAGEIESWSDGKETAMSLCKVRSCQYTDRTAAVELTVGQVKGNLLNNTVKVTLILTSHSLTHSLTTLSLSPPPWSKFRLEKLTGYQLVKKFSPFYGTLQFITSLTKACHLSLSWARSIQPTPPI